jgi:hypothetical protein
MLAIVLLDWWLNLSQLVYAVILLLSFLILLPLVPFMHKVHRSLIVITFSIFIVFTTYV